MAAIRPDPYFFSLACVLGLAACGPSKPEAPPEPPPGRFQIVQVEGLEPGTRVALQIDTATGSTWRLVPSTMPNSYDDIGWHLVADLTIESRTPYYRSRPDLYPGRKN